MPESSHNLYSGKMEKIIFNNIEFYKIKDFNDYYISKCGKVLSNNLYRRKHPIILKQGLASNGYLTISLNGNTKTIHRLVAKKFISNFLNKKFVNHIDGNKLNNNVDNLEWCTKSENEKHARKYCGKICTHKKKLAQYDLNWNLIKVWDNMRLMERETGFHRSCISNYIKKKFKHSYGYHWKIIK